MPWYPKKSPKSNNHICPVCNGTGFVIDVKTNKERSCVLCLGKGEFDQKGNARVYPMTQKEIGRIMTVVRLK